MTTFADLFDNLSASVRSELREHRVEVAFTSGDELFPAGAKPRFLYCLCSGRVKVWIPGRDGGALTLFYLGPGDTPGLVSIARGRPVNAATVAVTPVKAYRWSASVVERLLHRDARLANNGLRVVSAAMVAMVERLEDARSIRADQRLGRALLRLAGEHGEWDGNGEAAVDVSRQELADLTGVTLYTASRTLSDWARHGLVESSRGHVVIKDVHGLATLADAGS